jgi:heterodisulfide reductase subunit A
MYGIKEAIIAKEHQEGLDVSIFYMDIRAHGKEFDYYYKRAKEDLDIKFINSRVAYITEDEDKSPVLHYTSEDEDIGEATFDLVVLCTGLIPHEKSVELCNKLKLELNEFKFPRTSEFNPMETSRSGIYIAGAAGTPIDIPETVAGASGSASGSAGIIGIGRRAFEVEGDPDQTAPIAADKLEEEQMLSSAGPPRIGVFICHCGINISKVVDVEAVSEYAKGLPNVVHSENVLYACSQDMQDKIKDIVKSKNLNRVVVSSCTPRTHEPLFQNTISEVGINPYMFEMTNIREHCSWVHNNEPEDATEKAKALTKMAVAKSKLLYPLTKKSLDVNRSGLVIGGGLAGMTAALELSTQGFHVMLLEREAELGGNLNQIHSTIDGGSPGELLKSLVSEINARDNIELFTNAEIVTIDGYVGNFKTKIKYRPSGTENGSPDKLETDMEHGAIVVATGGYNYTPSEYHYQDSDRIITQRELEDKIHDGSFDGSSVVMIQCVGSRTETHGYCSRICCGEAVKNALELKAANPDVEIHVLYKDVRTYGMMEDYFRKASESGVQFLKYEDDQVPNVTVNSGQPKVEVQDRVIGDTISLEPDYLVLSAAVRPQDDNKVLSKMLKVPLNRDNFFLEAHMKLRPVDFATEGVFICGIAHNPKFIGETITQAKAAAMRAGIVLSKDYLETEGMVANVNEQACRGCGFCVAVCPYDAIELAEVNQYGHKVKVAKVNEVLCKGCGTCVATCLNGAIQQKMFDDNQLLSVLEKCLEVEEE